MITRWGSRDPEAPLIVVFQGSDSFGDALGGSSEADLATFARRLPGGAAYAAVRVPGPDLAAVRSWIDQHRAPQVPVVGQQFRFVTQGAYKPLQVNLSGDGTTLIQPVGMTFVKPTGQLAVTDGSINGLLLVDLSSSAVAKTFF